jgi:hypothetical protein
MTTEFTSLAMRATAEADAPPLLPCEFTTVANRATAEPDALSRREPAPEFNSMIEYDLRDALLSATSFKALLPHSGELLTWHLALYILAIISVTLLAAFFSCPQESAPSTNSLILGSAGCWRNTFELGYGDLTLSSLCAFLLGLLVNNVISRYWSTRKMVQEAMNATITLAFNLRMQMAPSSADAEFDTIRTEVTHTIFRRLVLAFKMSLFRAGSDRNASPQLADDFESTVMRKTGFITADEWETLGTNGVDKDGNKVVKRRLHPLLVLGWIVRDLQTLKDYGIIESHEPFLAIVTQLRTIYHDLPLFSRQQLPRFAVSLVACVVHLNIFQMVYVCASMIGAGLFTPNVGGKALSALFTIVCVPTVFLGILSLQDKLSNPLKRRKDPRTGKVTTAYFPVDFISNELDKTLVEVYNDLGHVKLEQGLNERREARICRERLGKEPRKTE